MRQLTVISPVALIDCVQPLGAIEVSEKVTAPANPLTAFTVTCEVPAVFAVVVIAGADSEKSWIVTGTFTLAVVVPEVPCTTIVKVAPAEQVTDRSAV